MTLVLQDPENDETIYLIESLLEASLTASEGAAIFSFASVGGARMLLNDDTFRQFMSSHPFELIVGIDAVTTSQALNAISEAVRDFDSANVSAFFHERRGALFHPKLCWFGNADGGIVVAGSGNLTLGGLRSNWEAYSYQTLDSVEFEEVRDIWDSWLAAFRSRPKHHSLTRFEKPSDVEFHAGHRKSFHSSQDQNLPDSTYFHFEVTQLPELDCCDLEAVFPTPSFRVASVFSWRRRLFAMVSEKIRLEDT